MINKSDFLKKIKYINKYYFCINKKKGFIIGNKKKWYFLYIFIEQWIKIVKNNNI